MHNIHTHTALACSSEFGRTEPRGCSEARIGLVPSEFHDSIHIATAYRITELQN